MTCRRRGVTLLEILIAGVCLAGASVGVLSALRFANDRTVVSRYRTLALQLVRSDIESMIGKGMNGSLTAGTTTQTLTSTGIPYTVTLTSTATRIGATTEYNITSQATWTMQTSNGPNAQLVRLDSLVRYNNVN